MRHLRAEGCLLEPLVRTHAHEMFKVLSDPAIYEFENEPPTSEEWLERRYALLELRSSPDGSRKWLNWVVRLPNGRLAGYVQATAYPDAVALVAYELNSAYWRRGIGRAAVRTMLQELEARYEVRRFVAVLKATNFRSEGLLTRLGFDPADEEEAAAWRDTPDERVMVKGAGGTGDVA